jgi:hypothetical protein
MGKFLINNLIQKFFEFGTFWSFFLHLSGHSATQQPAFARERLSMINGEKSYQTRQQ